MFVSICFERDSVLKAEFQDQPLLEIYFKCIFQGDTLCVVSTALRKGWHKTIPGWQPSCDPNGRTGTMAVVPAKQAMKQFISNPLSQLVNSMNGAEKIAQDEVSLGKNFLDPCGLLRPLRELTCSVLPS